MPIPDTTPSPKILLFGSGAIGTIYLYLLQKAGCDVTVVCRSNYTAAKQNGFHIDSKKFGNGIHVVPDGVVRSIDELIIQNKYKNEDEGKDKDKIKGEDESKKKEFDYILICSKAFPGNKPSTASLIAPAVGPATTIVLIQNGIGIEEEYKILFPMTTVLTCVVYLPTTQVSPGVIRMGDFELLEIGVYSSSSSSSSSSSVSLSERQYQARDLAKAERLRALIIKAGGTAVLYKHIQIRRWKKLLLNASLNPICALSRSSDAFFATSSDLAEGYLRGVMEEVVNVGLAAGLNEGVGEHGNEDEDEDKDDEGIEFGKHEIGIGAADVEHVMQRIRDRIGTEGVEPSMLADVRNGRRMEVEAVVGNVVRIGKAKGVDVGRLEGLYVLIKALDESFVRDAAGRG